MPRDVAASRGLLDLNFYVPMSRRFDLLLLVALYLVGFIHGLTFGGYF